MYLTQIDRDMPESEDLACPQDMAWAVCHYSLERVNKAATDFIKFDQSNVVEIDLGAYLRRDEALAIINNWRSCHSFPLNTFRTWLRIKAAGIDPKSLVAQRIKRLSSIKSKLERFPKMKLTQMQDIAGCRAVVHTVAQVRQLADAYALSDLKHVSCPVDDYIVFPKPSGYRGIHLVYRYFSDRNRNYNGLKVEVQLRSVLQHAWATAVETVGTFTRQALKSSQGEAEWLRFFALMGTAIAKRENCNPVPQTPADSKDLKNQLIDYIERLDVLAKLAQYSGAIQVVTQSKADFYYFLVELDPVAMKTQIMGYAKNQLEKASNDYLTIEKRIQSGENIDAVLVSVDSLSVLERAYPNYFLDTHLFITAVKEAIK